MDSSNSLGRFYTDYTVDLTNQVVPLAGNPGGDAFQRLMETFRNASPRGAFQLYLEGNAVVLPACAISARVAIQNAAYSPSG